LNTVDADTYKIKISSLLKKKNAPVSLKNNFEDYEGKEIFLPDKFLPSIEFLKIHNQQRFKY
jgi:hypothetical protein